MPSSSWLKSMARENGPSWPINWKKNSKSVRALANSAVKGKYNFRSSNLSPLSQSTELHIFAAHLDGTIIWTRISTRLRLTRWRRSVFLTCIKSLEISGPTSPKIYPGAPIIASKTTSTQLIVNIREESTSASEMLKSVSHPV